MLRKLTLQKSEFTEHIRCHKKLITLVSKTRELLQDIENHWFTRIFGLNVIKFSITISVKSNFTEFYWQWQKMCLFEELVLDAISFLRSHITQTEDGFCYMDIFSQFISSEGIIGVNFLKSNMRDRWVETSFI